MVQMGMCMMGLFIVHPKAPTFRPFDRDFGFLMANYELKPGIELHYPMGLRSVENLELVW